jgi:hypothetical protein
MKKNLLIAFVSGVLLLALVMGCKQDPDPEPTPLTKNITVPEITAVKNPMDFGAVSALQGWDADFPASDVTYKLTLVHNTSGDTTTFPDSTESISASGLANGAHTLTQTFYYKGNPITNGSRNVIVGVSANAFMGFTGILAELTLTLSKPR